MSLGHEALTVSKAYDKADPVSLGFSADWIIRELPGLVLYLDKHPSAEYPGWRCYWSETAWADYDPKNLKTTQRACLAKTIGHQLAGQAFATRRETLQAIEMVMVMADERA